LVGPLSWQVELDERWVVLGPNGAGKTSLLKIAAALEYPSTGTAVILGEQLGRTEVTELRSRLGLSSVAVAGRIPGDEVVQDLVISAGYAVLGRWREKYDPEDFERAADTLESIGAEHLAERTWGTLSEGERKRVLIARAMMTDPELLLLDEPGAGRPGGPGRPPRGQGDGSGRPRHGPGHPPRGGDPPGVHPRHAPGGGRGHRDGADRRGDHLRQSQQGLLPVDRRGRDRRTLLRA